MSDVTTAVILAAGMGTRLEALGSELPKGFLRLGTQPIIEESIARLQAAGMRRIVIVTGHLAVFYKLFAARYPGLVETVHNPHYRETGSMYSLYCARPRLGDDFLLLESDLVYELRALTECLASPHASTLLLSGLTHSGDEVFVQADGGRLEYMSKDPTELTGPIAGELVGITKVSAELYAALIAAAERLYKASGHQRHHYETDALVAAARDVPVACHLVADLCWCEIDDARHLRRAREEIYPRIGDAGPALSLALKP